MIIDNSNVKEINELLKIDDKCVIKNSITNDNLFYLIDQIFQYEGKNKDVNIRIQLDDFSTNQLISIFKFFFSKKEKIELIRNVSFILNIVNLLKTYNTFDDNFFSSEDIFFNSIDQMLDLKAELQDNLQNLSIKIMETFISMCRTLPKTEYSILDQYEDVPNFFKVLFCSMNMINLCEILSIVPSNVNLEFKKYKFTSPYIEGIFQAYSDSNKIIEAIASNTLLINGAKNK